MYERPPDCLSAFPVVENGRVLSYGASLRDAFAIAALQGWAASGQLQIEMTENGPFGNVSRWCYQVADAMLAARVEDTQA